MPQQYDGRPPTCPPWCELGHGIHTGEDDTVHIGGKLCVRNTLMRLVATIDPETGAQDGPYVLMGTQELTITEVHDLIAALTTLAANAATSATATNLAANAATAARAATPRIPSPREAV